MAITEEQHVALIRCVERIRLFKNRALREIALRFWDLPSQDENSELYEKISKPRSINLVRQLLVEGRYDSPKLVYQDLKLVFQNGQYFFNRSTEAWRDGNRMEAAVTEVFEDESDILGPVADLEEQEPDPQVEAALQASKKKKYQGPGKYSETDKICRPLLSAYRTGNQETYTPPYREPTLEETEKRLPIEGLLKPGEKPAVEQAQPLLESKNASPLMLGSPTFPASALASPAKLEGLSTRNSRAGSTESDASALADDFHSPYKERQPDESSGWMADFPSSARQNILTAIYTRMRKQTDQGSSRLLCEVLLKPPSRTIFPRFYQKTGLPTLTDVESKLAHQRYTTAESFDRDISQIFANAKTWLDRSGPLQHFYRDTLTLQRFYNAWTSPSASSSTGLGWPVAAPTDFRSEACQRVKNDHVMLSSINYKGDTLRPGDWIHVANPPHPEQPIVAQIWRVFRRARDGHRCVRVCWFCRPQDTVHPITRQFYKDEVLKTTHVVEHDIEDVLEKCFVMHITKYVKGRPKAPLWNVEMPIYVCESRYKEADKSITKIKDWTTATADDDRAENTQELDLFPVPLTLRKVKPVAMQSESATTGKPVVGASSSTRLFGHMANGSSLSSMPIPTRTFATKFGKSATFGPRPTEIMAAGDSFEPLPQAVSALFRTHPVNNEILWFPTPPVSGPTMTEPVHSFDYLLWKAKQGRKAGPKDMDPRQAKRPKLTDHLRDYL